MMFRSRYCGTFGQDEDIPGRVDLSTRSQGYPKSGAHTYRNELLHEYETLLCRMSFIDFLG